MALPRIVVLSYGNGPARHCVAGLLESGCPPEHIVVVHNRSPGDERPIGIPREIALVDTGANLGYSGGMNIGLRLWRETAGAVVLLTHDVVMSYPDAVSLGEVLEVSPDAAAVAPLLKHPNGSILSAGGDIDRWGNVRHRSEPSNERPYVVGWLDGAALAVRSTAPDLPEDYFLYFEDVAYSLAMRAAGFRLYVMPETVAVTSPGAAVRPEAFRYFHWRNRIACVRAQLGWRALAYTLARLLTVAALRCGQAVVRRRPSDAARLMHLYWRAARDGLTGHLGAPDATVATLIRS